MFEDHGPGDAAARMPHKVLQQGKLFCCQVYANPGNLHDMLHAIQLQIGDSEYRLRGNMASPDQPPDSGRQFAEGEGFSQVVVCSGVEALDPVLDLCTLC